jgi:hypothetical protein
MAWLLHRRALDAAIQSMIAAAGTKRPVCKVSEFY